MTLTDTKSKRLVIIVVGALAILSASTVLRVVTSRSADRQAGSFADRVAAELRQYEGSDLDDLLAQESISDWEGKSSPLMVDGRRPERYIEVRGGTVARYRLRETGGDRCVDALWPENGTPKVSVNDCIRYERPPAR